MKTIKEGFAIPDHLINTITLYFHLFNIRALVVFQLHLNFIPESIRVDLEARPWQAINNRSVVYLCLLVVTVLNLQIDTTDIGLNLIRRD